MPTITHEMNLFRRSLVGTLRFAHPAKRSKSCRQRQPHCERFGGMHMAIGNAADRLARQARQIVIFDLVGLRVEQIEHVELQPHPVVEFVAGAGVKDQGLSGADAVILDWKCPRPA